MPPFIPTPGDLVSSFFNSFLDIFRDSGREAVEMAIAALLQIGRPDFTAQWFLSIYAYLFAIGFLGSILLGLLQGLQAVFREDAYGFGKSFLMPLKHFFLGSYLPYLFTVGFTLSSYLSQEIALLMPAESSLELLGLGSLATDFFFFPILVVQGIFFSLEVFTVQWVMPYLVVLFFVISSGFSSMSATSKGYNTMLALSLTSIFAQFVMTLSLVVSSLLIQGISGSVVDFTGWQTFAYWLVISFTMYLPWLLYKNVKTRVQTMRVVNAMKIDGQIRSINQVQQHSSKSSGGAGVIAVGAGIAGGIAIDRLIEAQKDDPTAGKKKSAQAVKIAAKAAQTAAVSKSGIAVKAAGPMGVAALVGSSIVQRSAQKKTPPQQGTGSP